MPQENRRSYSVVETHVENEPVIIRVVTVACCGDFRNFGGFRATSGKPTAYTGSISVSTQQAQSDAPAIDLSRTPELQSRVLKRLESISATSTMKRLTRVQQTLVCELLGNGHSVYAVADAFNVAESEVQRLID